MTNIQKDKLVNELNAFTNAKKAISPIIVKEINEHIDILSKTNNKISSLDRDEVIAKAVKLRNKTENILSKALDIKSIPNGKYGEYLNKAEFKKLLKSNDVKLMKELYKFTSGIIHYDEDKIINSSDNQNKILYFEKNLIQSQYRNHNWKRKGQNKCHI